MRPRKAIVCDLFVEKVYTCLHLPAYTLLKRCNVVTLIKTVDAILYT